GPAARPDRRHRGGGAGRLAAPATADGPGPVREPVPRGRPAGGPDVALLAAGPGAVAANGVDRAAGAGAGPPLRGRGAVLRRPAPGGAGRGAGVVTRSLGWARPRDPGFRKAFTRGFTATTPGGVPEPA